ncbi:hypothetical protein HLB44_03610 [Aquincola sp. S2]|uniref:DUF6249 domain-containing protein n=1 Tax=Pseudaquabacterium terrae TaxID=2732868 RepID=A0ABX2EBZ6_9BURK|nr:DUF6249 domain-containing protein [Aquabacterium terrae]NRF66071.1 hypothetical protein [Aquabacterium terrae]
MDMLLDKETLIPVVAMLIGAVALLLPALIVWVVLHFRRQRDEQLFATVRHLAERGLPVPRELIDPPSEQEGRGGSPLFRAITLVGVGLGLVLLFWLMGMHFLIGVGLMVMCIGAAQLVALWIERRRPAPGATAAAAVREP